MIGDSFSGTCESKPHDPPVMGGARLLKVTIFHKFLDHAGRGRGGITAPLHDITQGHVTLAHHREQERLRRVHVADTNALELKTHHVQVATVQPVKV